ncbi:MAG: glycosyltransferase family 2 protein [Rhodocyclales bacterium]|nr:glycosyltransferase family 2 protein [Rhodocyclales bacterium]
MLSIGVAAHGNVAITEECLKSIFASVVGDFELLLIDDASPDDMLPLFHDAAEFHPNTRIYHFPENLEYSQSVNCLLNEARGERVLFVSNDIFITPSYVAALLETMSDPTIGIARGVSNFVDNDLPSHNLAEKQSADGWQALVDFAAARYALEDAALVDDPFLIGDAFMVSRALLDAIGGFDIDYCGYMSDIDFGLRAVGAQFRRVLCPRAYAWHVRSSNFNYLDDSARAEKLERRRKRVFAAWDTFATKWEIELTPGEWFRLAKIPFAELDAKAGLYSKRKQGPVSYEKFLVFPIADPTVR